MTTLVVLRRFVIACLEGRAQSRPLWIEPPPLKVQCGWCRVVMSEGVEPVSHGICEACIEKFEHGEHAEGRAA